MEHQGCDGECMRKKTKQTMVKPQTRQALALSIPGPIQTTPRAELWAILMAVEMEKTRKPSSLIMLIMSKRCVIWLAVSIKCCIP